MSIVLKVVFYIQVTTKTNKFPGFIEYHNAELEDSSERR